MDDLIRRSEAIRVASGYCHWSNIPAELAKLPSVSTEKTDAYKQGWHDAICKALDEVYDIVIDGERFGVVQEETLIGLGTAYEQVSTEKTGRWIDMDDGFSPCECSECGKVDFIRSKYCPNCGAKMEVVND